MRARTCPVLVKGQAMTEAPTPIQPSASARRRAHAPPRRAPAGCSPSSRSGRSWRSSTSSSSTSPSPRSSRASPAARPSSLSWVLNAYAIVFAACLVPAGRLADLLGRRRTFQLGLIVFAIASAACALAPTLAVLVAARAVQAVGAALLIPTSLGPAAARLPACPAGGGDRRLGRRRRGRRGGRPGPRRPARRGELEADLPRQHPARRRGADRLVARARRGSPSGGRRPARPRGDCAS